MTCGSCAWSLDALSIASHIFDLSNAQSKSFLPFIFPILFKWNSPVFCATSSSFARSGVPKPYRHNAGKKSSGRYFSARAEAA